jgi:signal transduction histidine kinase
MKKASVEDMMRGRPGLPVPGPNEERLRRLDLHDETGQLLTAVLINLQHLEKLTDPGQMKDTVRDTRDLIEMLFHSIRAYLRGRGDGPPAGGGAAPEIVPALQRLTGEFSRRTGIEVMLEPACDPERLPTEHKAVIYRVVQESLTNVFKHTAASRVIVRCARTGERVRLEIEDDGLRGDGAPRAARERAGPGSGGNGLRGMRERIRLVGGEFHARLVRGRGMSIVVELPYNIS